MTRARGQAAPQTPNTAIPGARSTEAVLIPALMPVLLRLSALLQAAMTPSEVVDAVASHGDGLYALLSGAKSCGRLVLELQSEPSPVPAIGVNRSHRREVTGADGRPLGVLTLLSGQNAEFGGRVGAMLEAVTSLVTPALQRVLADSELAADLASVRANEQFLSALLRYGPDNLTVIDENWIIRYISPAGADMLGYSPDELIGTLGAAIIHPDEVATAAMLNRRRMTQPDAPQFEVAYRFRRKDGGWHPVTLFSTNALDDPHVRGLVIHIRDATGRQIREEALARKALHDPLTGLPNRLLFDERLWAALRREDRAGVAVLYVDLDDFKRVNDTQGHPAGDAVLVEVAQRLQSELRDEDTVARFGGDEFVVLLDGVDAATAMEIAQRLLVSLQPPIDTRGGEIAVGASIGMAFAAAEETASTRLLHAADRALYRAKAAGKGRVFEADATL